MRLVEAWGKSTNFFLIFEKLQATENTAREIMKYENEILSHKEINNGLFLFFQRFI